METHSGGGGDGTTQRLASHHGECANRRQSGGEGRASGAPCPPCCFIFCASTERGWMAVGLRCATRSLKIPIDRGGVAQSSPSRCGSCLSALPPRPHMPKVGCTMSHHAPWWVTALHPGRSPPPPLPPSKDTYACFFQTRPCTGGMLVSPQEASSRAGTCSGDPTLPAGHRCDVAHANHRKFFLAVGAMPGLARAGCLAAAVVVVALVAARACRMRRHGPLCVVSLRYGGCVLWRGQHYGVVGVAFGGRVWKLFSECSSDSRESPSLFSECGRHKEHVCMILVPRVGRYLFLPGYEGPL
jgi:hypothetical protein